MWARQKAGRIFNVNRQGATGSASANSGVHSRRNGGSHATSPSRNGFTLVELTIVIAIVILLMALLLPSISALQADRNQALCANHQRQIGAGLLLARGQEEAIAADNWTGTILPFINNDASLLRCPLHTTGDVSFGMNNRAHRFGDEDASRVVLLDYHKTNATLVVDDIRNQDPWNETAGTYAARHAGSVNVLYHSGAVQAQSPESIDPRASDVWLANWRPHRDTFELEGAAGDESTKSAGEQFFAGISSGSTNDDTLGPVLTQTSVPDYPPVDPSSCADTEFDGDNLNGSIYSATYDAANDYPALIESPPGSGNFFPFFGDQQAKFRTPPYVPTDLIGEPYSADYLIAEGHQAPDTTEATFTFNVEPGRYNVWIHWPGHVRHSDTTPIKVLDDATQLHTESVNQEVYSGQAALDAGKTPLVETNGFGQELSWYPLGEHETTSGVLKIVVSAAAGAVDGAEGFMSHMVVADAVRIECANVRPYHADRCFGEAPAPIDDGDAGYTATSGWQNVVSGDSVGGSHKMLPTGTPGETIMHEFTNLTPGQYSVWTFFKPAAGQASNAIVSVYEGERRILRSVVDQTKSYLGAELDGDGRYWYKIGSCDIEQEAVRVIANGNANGVVVADAMRLVCAHGSLSCDDGVAGRACRRAQAELYGGSDATEAAVDRGLNWLARHQYIDGAWNYDHQGATGPYIRVPEPCNGQCSHVGSAAENRVAATGMALLPFLAAGIGPSDTTYGQVVEKGILYLMSEIDGDGNLSRNEMQAYEQGIGTMALAEALGVCRASGFGNVNEAQLSLLVERAVSRVVFCLGENPEVDRLYGRAWSYTCNEPHLGFSDISVTAWMTRAFLAGERAGIDVDAMEPQDTMDDIHSVLSFLSRHPEPFIGPTYPDPIFGDYEVNFKYRRVPGSSVGYSGAGAASHMGRFLSLETGAPPQALGMRESADRELDRIIGGMPNESYRNFYATEFMYGMGGDYWSTWEASMRQFLLQQNPPGTVGHERGSWMLDSVSLIRNNCGRLWSTVAATLALQQYYRDSHAVGPLRSQLTSGDRDGDGDVDNMDIIVAFSNFTGPNPDPPAPSFGRTRLQGDVHPHPFGDGDVDNQDFQTMFNSFTGPGG